MSVQVEIAIIRGAVVVRMPSYIYRDKTARGKIRVAIYSDYPNHPIVLMSNTVDGFDGHKEIVKQVSNIIFHRPSLVSWKLCDITL